VAKLASWDGLGVRPGLFRVQSLYLWVDQHRESFGGAFDALAWACQHGILLLLVAGLAIHFTPASWTERFGARCVRALPGPLLGAALAVVALLIAHALDGPRANIYFAF
jgi:hypothetical protein